MSDKIKPHHVERKAILYVRQSSAYRVQNNLASQKLQARSPRDRRYRHRHLLHVASIETVFSAPSGPGPVAVRPAGPL